VTKLEFADIVAALCKRPAAYTLHGTLPEVLAYLDGYGKAAVVQPGSHWGTSGFFAWLAKKLGKTTTRGDDLLLTFGGEEAALKALAQLYREYATLDAAVGAQRASRSSES
jgi:hypothetical protein